MLTGGNVQPPTVMAKSFISDGINEAESATVYADFGSHNVIDGQGAITSGFSIDTDLSFLFTDLAKSMQQYLAGLVRAVLLHTPWTVQAGFSTAIDPRTESDAAAFSFNPTARISMVAAAKDPMSITLLADLRRGTDYTLSMHNAVRAANGSTLDPGSSTAHVRID